MRRYRRSLLRSFLMRATLSGLMTVLHQCPVKPISQLLLDYQLLCGTTLNLFCGSEVVYFVKHLTQLQYLSPGTAFTNLYDTDLHVARKPLQWHGRLPLRHYHQPFGPVLQRRLYLTARKQCRQQGNKLTGEWYVAIKLGTYLRSERTM